MRERLLSIGAELAVVSNAVRSALAAYDIAAEINAHDARRRLASEDFSAVLLHISSIGDAAILHQVFEYAGRIPVLVHQPEGSPDDAMRWMRQGAFFAFIGPLDPERLQQVAREAVEHSAARRRLSPALAPWRRLLIGQSQAILQICEIIELVAAKRCTVLIGGETGTGKEMVARALHAAGNRAALPMVAVNCTALPGSLIEAELFGHAKGAFTGAYASRVGRFEQAHRSSIFLDEIGDLPLEAQAKLLRVLQEQEFQRIGSSETVKIDVRVIAASNIDLEQAVRERKFREDLYYRLNVVPIHLPPLRERREDIPLLAEHFLEKIRAAENAVPKQLTPEAAQFLCDQSWPGNVRQLEHAVQMAVALSGDRRVLYPNDFVRRKRPAESAQAPARPTLVVSHQGIDFDEAVSSFERSLLNQALAVSGGNKARAADLLGIKRTTLLAKIKTLEARDSGRSPSNATAGADNPIRSALVFEPNTAVRRMIARTLQGRRYRVLEAATSAAAKEILECWRGTLSVIIAAAEESAFTRELPSQPEIPSLLLANDDGSFPAQLGKVLCRPFTPEDLVSALDDILANPSVPASYCA
jgi:DNA-binding NtrC family response regulator/CheY-like chemotaxis protein